MVIRKKKILVADDEPVILKIIQEELSNVGYLVDIAEDGEVAWLKFKNGDYDFVILDNRMPKNNGIEVLKKIMNLKPQTPVIVMTAFGIINEAVEVMKLGAFDYITKPFENDDLICKVGQAFKAKDSLDINIKNNDNMIKIIGSSNLMVKLQKKIIKIKDLDTTILLTGESGTGKGVYAKEIYNLSNRRNEPFIHVNCAVLPENLIESELFGHEKGSFTGAIENKKGKFELAGNGIIFLDEIGTLDHSLQAKLLMALQEKKFEKIGSCKTIELKARIITATNINLEEAVRLKKFREDLYYRINVISIECPPLRYRKEDITELTLHFLDKFNRRLNKDIKEISNEVWDIFLNYNWPGNIRELENTLESTIALSSGSILYEEDIPLRIKYAVGNTSTSNIKEEHNIFELDEIRAIKRVLKNNNGHRKNSAIELGISRRTLQYKLKKFGLLD